MITRKSTLLSFALMLCSLTYAQTPSATQVTITNNTDHTIRRLRCKFKFVGKNTISENNHAWGKVVIKKIDPQETIVIDPVLEATQVGVLGPIARYFEDPQVLLVRIDSGKIHRNFHHGTFRKIDLSIYTHKEKDIVTSSNYYDIIQQRKIKKAKS